MILETVVGRARADRHRARSDLTHEVKVIEAGKVNVDAAFVKITSGQLPFLM
jgi:tmRNA-binding protein